MPIRGQVSQLTLEPGFTLLADYMPESSGVALGLWFYTGSAWEGPSERGLSHFVEHMVFKGAGNRDAAELSRVIDREGGYLNAFTERDTVCIHCTMPKDKARLALDIIMDMTYRPHFRSDEFEREKDIIANEILSAGDDLEEAGHDEFYAMTYPDHAAGCKIAGSVDDVRSARFTDLQSFHQQHFAGGDMVLTCAGAIEPQVLAQWVQEAMPAQRGYSGGKSGPGIARFNPVRKAMRAPGSQILLFSGQPLPADLDEKAYWLLAALDSAFGESMSSRLFMRLRERDGLCYNISSTYSIGKAQSLWGVYASTSPQQFERFAPAYRRELCELQEKGLLEHEVEESRMRLLGMLSLASDDCEYRMKRLARMYLMNSRVEDIQTMADACLAPEQLNDQTVNAFIRDHLDISSENVLLFGKINAKAQRAAKVNLCFSSAWHKKRGKHG